MLKYKYILRDRLFIMASIAPLFLNSFALIWYCGDPKMLHWQSVFCGILNGASIGMAIVFNILPLWKRFKTELWLLVNYYEEGKPVWEYTYDKYAGGFGANGMMAQFAQQFNIHYTVKESYYVSPWLGILKRDDFKPLSRFEIAELTINSTGTIVAYSEEEYERLKALEMLE